MQHPLGSRFQVAGSGLPPLLYNPCGLRSSQAALSLDDLLLQDFHQAPGALACLGKERVLSGEMVIPHVVYIAKKIVVHLWLYSAHHQM